MVKDVSKGLSAVTIGVVVLTIAIFVLDLMLPLGYAVSLIYPALIIVFLWGRGMHNVYFFAVLVTVLTVAGFMFSAADDTSRIAAIFNRFISVVVTWVAGFLISRYQITIEANSKKLQQYHALYTSATEAIIVTDERGRIVMANPRSHELFGYAPNKLMGRVIEELVPKRYRGKHEDHRHNFHGDPHSRLMGAGRDLYALRADGSEFPVEISLSFYKQEGKLYVISFVIDITYRKTSEEALLKAKQNLERYAEALQNSNRELEQFAYVASHDLQEPLRKIQAFGDRLRTKEQGNISEDSLDYLNRMLNAAGRMKGLINDLLSFSRITTQAKPFQKIDLDKVLGEVLTDLEVAIEKAEAKVVHEPLPAIEADPLQMRQLFQNLLSNAIKFRREGVQPEIKVYGKYTDEGKSEIQIFVQDNGIGFDEKYLDKIFNIFQRLEGKDFEGSGVGLAICRKIAQRHKGDITAKSTPGEGTTFIITLPVKQ